MSAFDLKPASGSRKPATRRARGIGCGKGKTAGRGHKGQKSRAGGSVRLGFEGGQNPLYLRIPKFGFTSRKGRVTIKLRLSDLNQLADADCQDVTVALLAERGIVGKHAKHVKVYLSGEIKKPVKLIGIRASKGALAAIQAAGGEVSDQ